MLITTMMMMTKKKDDIKDSNCDETSSRNWLIASENQLPRGSRLVGRKTMVHRALKGYENGSGQRSDAVGGCKRNGRQRCETVKK